MKKLLFTLLLIVLFNLSTSAQFEFGTYYIDCNINYDLSNVKMDNVTETSTKNSNLTFTPEVGYFINNNLAIGIGVSYINNFDSNTNMTFSSYVNGNLDYKMYPSYSVGLNEIAPLVFIKYFYQPTNKLSFSLRASYALGWGTYTLIQKYTKEPQGQETIFKSE